LKAESDSNLPIPEKKMAEKIKQRGIVTMGIKIRRAGIKDFDSIHGLLIQLWDYKKINKASLKRLFITCMSDKNYMPLIALSGKTVVGFAGTTVFNMLWQEGKMIHLNELVVAEGERGSGTGSKMLKYIETMAKKRGCKGIDLESAMFRKRTHKFYENRGYVKKAYYFYKLF